MLSASNEFLESLRHGRLLRFLSAHPECSLQEPGIKGQLVAIHIPPQESTQEEPIGKVDRVNNDPNLTALAGLIVMRTRGQELIIPHAPIELPVVDQAPHVGSGVRPAASLPGA